MRVPEPQKLTLIKYRIGQTCHATWAPPVYFCLTKISPTLKKKLDIIGPLTFDGFGFGGETWTGPSVSSLYGYIHVHFSTPSFTFDIQCVLPSNKAIL